MYKDGHPDDVRYRGKLKQKIIYEFGDRLCRLKIDSKTLEVIVSTKGVSTTTISNQKTIILNEAAQLLREDVMEYASKFEETEWPPTTASLRSRLDTIPESVLQFMESLLKNPGHACSEKVQRLVTSFSGDIIYGITQGKVLTLKHFLLGLGLHDLIDQKLAIRILSRLGHSVSYDTVTSIETAQAEVSQFMYEQGTSEGLKPIAENGMVFTYFWADNFNKEIENENIAMIDSTHMVKFQEKTDSTTMQEMSKIIPKTKKRYPTTI